jgi:tRNA (adenine57-N1/adenine58-N1)-methyltransferase
MIAHTAFLVSARRLAPGVTAPPRRRKPSKGAEAYALRRQEAGLGRVNGGPGTPTAPEPPTTVPVGPERGTAGPAGSGHGPAGPDAS